MEYVIQIDEENGIISAIAHGEWNSTADNTMIREIMDLVETKRLNKILLDISALQFDFPVVQIFERAREVREYRLQKTRVSSKVALIYSASNPKVEQDMHFFETVSRNRSLPYRVFTNVNDARKWLAAP